MALYNHGVRQGVGTSMSASCAAGWGAYLYPFYSQMAKVERGETVRKGYEQRSDRGFGWFKEGEMDGKAPLWRPAGLRCKCLRCFSDSLGSSVLGSLQPGATPK